MDMCVLYGGLSMYHLCLMSQEKSQLEDTGSEF